MKTISIISQKGGSGKTTLAVHLAAAAAAAGRVAVVVDTDPQATASRWGEWRGGAEPEVISCAAPPLLARTLEQAAQLGAEVAIIDTPPHADSMSAAACRAADLILIPCRPRAFDLDAIQTTADLVKISAKPAAVIFTAGPPNAPRLYLEAGELVAGFGLDVAAVAMPQRAAYSDATGSGQAAPEIEPEGKAADEIAALWDWVSQRASIPTRQRASKNRKAAA